MIPSAVLLSVFNGTGSCLWPSSSSVIISWIASCAFMYNLPHSASAADDITCCFSALDACCTTTNPMFV